MWGVLVGVRKGGGWGGARLLATRLGRSVQNYIDVTQDLHQDVLWEGGPTVRDGGR